MKSISSLICLFLAIYSPLQASAAVVDLTDATFEHQTQSSTGQTTGKWFVKFYAPWCGHCKTLAPIWEQLDQRIQESNPQDGILLAKVDCTKSTEVANRFSIRSYPTLKYFADRKMFNYKGARNIEALYDFVTDGYKSAEADTIPTPPSVYDAKMKELRKKFNDMTKDHEQLKFLLDDFEHIVEFRKNAAAVLLIIGFIVGFIFHMVASLLKGSGKDKSKAKSKKE